MPAEEPVEAPETAEEVSDNEEAVEGAGKPESDMENIISTLGIEMIDKNTAAVATDSLYGNRLHIRAFISRETNRRKYLIFEVDKAGQELGTTGCDSLFKASEVSNGSSKIKHLLQELDGQYAGQIADILKRIAIIEKRRLLVTVDTLDIDSCRTFEELWVMLQNWFESHLDDKRVGVVDIKGRTHVVLVKRGRQGLNEVFQSVIKEIAPNLKANWVKGELYRRELIYHDANDICKDKQLTVSLFVRAELGISNDKVMSFAFDEEVIEHMKEGYEILHCDYEEEE